MVLHENFIYPQILIHNFEIDEENGLHLPLVSTNQSFYVSLPPFSKQILNLINGQQTLKNIYEILQNNDEICWELFLKNFFILFQIFNGYGWMFLSHKNSLTNLPTYEYRN